MQRRKCKKIRRKWRKIKSEAREKEKNEAVKRNRIKSNTAGGDEESSASSITNKSNRGRNNPGNHVSKAAADHGSSYAVSQSGRTNTRNG